MLLSLFLPLLLDSEYAPYRSSYSGLQSPSSGSFILSGRSGSRGSHRAAPPTPGTPARDHRLDAGFAGLRMLADAKNQMLVEAARRSF